MAHTFYRIHWSFVMVSLAPSACSAAPVVALIPQVRMQYKDRAALPYQWACRLEASFIRHGVGTLHHSGRLQTAQTDLLHAAARCGVLGDNCNLGDFETRPNCPESENQLHCGRVVQVAQLHPPLGAAWSTGPAYSSGTRALRHRRQTLEDTEIVSSFPTVIMKAERHWYRIACQWI